MGEGGTFHLMEGVIANTTHSIRASSAVEGITSATKEVYTYGGWSSLSG